MIGVTEIIQNCIYFISLYYVVFWLLVLISKEIPKAKHLKEYPAVSIIVPAYNEEENIVPTLKSLEAIDYPQGKLSVYVMDDGSTDRTYERAKAYAQLMIKNHQYKKVVVLTQKNKGKYAAMNAALKIIDTEFFASLDADSIPKKDSLKRIMEQFGDEKVAGVSPILKVYKPKNFLQFTQYFEYAVNHFYKSVVSKVNAIHVLPGPLSVYRTAVVKKIGCFRDAHKTEDMEIVMRIQQAHYKVIQCNDAFVYTKTPYTLKSLYHQRHRWNYGTFRNLLDYRKMIFNSKYGDFGVFQLPMMLVSGFIGIVVVGLVLYGLWKGARPLFQLLQLYHFNFITYLQHSTFNFIWLDVDVRSVITFAMLLLITFLIVRLSFKLYKEKYSYKMSVSFIFYLFFYYLFLAVVWINVFKDYLIGTKVEWRK